MAEFRAYQRVDMLDFGLPRDNIEQINLSLAFMEVSDGHWYLYGDYKDPDDGWRGEIKRIDVYDLFGDLAHQVRGLDLKTVTSARVTFCSAPSSRSP